MIHRIVFPEFSEEDDDKAELVAWFVAVGDTVEEGDELLELLTDKATFTVPSPAKGTIRSLTISPGTTVAVGDVLGEIESD